MRRDDSHVPGKRNHIMKTARQARSLGRLATCFTGALCQCLPAGRALSEPAVPSAEIVWFDGYRP